MTTRSDLLQIRLETTGDGKVKASLVDVAQGADRAANDLDKLNRELAQVSDRANPGARALRQLADDEATLQRALQAGVITQSQYNAQLRQLETSARQSSSGFAAMGQTLGAIGLAEAARQVIATNIEFERLTTVVATFEGSQAAANERLRELRAVAAETPNQLQEIVRAYTILKARGLDPSREALIAYANVAAASGKTIEQFIEAVADAATGEFERLKEFGVVARQQGDEIALTFQGTTTVIERNAAAIEGYLRGIGENQFGGAAARQMDTLGGAISNLRDQVTELAVAIGQSGLTDDLTELTRRIGDLVRVAAQLNELSTSGRGFFGGLLGVVRSANDTLRDLVLPGLGSEGLREFGLRVGMRRDLREARIDEQAAAAAAEEASIIGRLEEAYRSAADVISGIYKKAKQESAKTSEEARKKAEDLLKQLREEQSVYGLSQVQVLEYRKAKALATTTDAAARAEIEKLFDSMIATNRATEAAAKLAKAKAEADREAEREAAKLRQEIDRQRGVAQRLVEAYDPAIRQAREFAEADAALSRAVEDGTLTLEKRAEILSKLRFDQLIEQVRQAGEAFRELPDRIPLSEIEGREVGMRFAGGLRDAIVDGLLSGDWESVGRRLLNSLFGDWVSTTLQRVLVDPLQQAIGNGAGIIAGLRQIFAGRGFESAPDFVGPPSTLAGGSGGGGAGGGAGWMGMLGNAGIGYSIGGGIFGGSRQSQMGGMLGGVAGGIFAGTTLGAGVIGAGLSAMGMGAALGSVVPIVGTIVGAVLGAALGSLFSSKPDPRIRVNSTGQGIGRPGASGRSDFGRVFINVDDMPGDTDDKLLDAIIRFDDAIAQLVRSVGGGAEELSAIRERLANLSVDARGGQATPEEVLSQRFNAIVEAIEPAWRNFLGNIEDLQQRVEAFEALFGIRQQVEDLDTTLARLSLDPVVRLATELAALTDRVDETAAALAEAIEANDPQQIRDASAAAQQAVIQRFEAEIRLARELEAALLQAEAAARSTSQQIADRIQAAGGPAGLAAGVALGNLGTLRGLVGSTADPERALGFLSEFVGTVDAWLAASIRDVQQLAAAEANRINIALQGINAQRNAINEALASLQAERDEIMAAATERARAQQDAARAAAQAEQQRRQAEIAALQEQLGLAQQFVRVLESAQQFLAELQLGPSSPLSGFSRLDALNRQIQRAESDFAGASGSGRADAAQALLDLLQQRMGLVQGEGLFQRPSADFLALYNDTVRRASEVRDAVQPEADRALQLQELLAQLQQDTLGAVQDLGTLAIRLTRDERERLDAISEREEDLNDELLRLELATLVLQRELLAVQQNAEAEIAALNATAREQYEWAQGEAERLAAERNQQILDQLETLTGGRPVDEFIAERSAEATRLLTDIRDTLRDFLEAIANAAGESGTAPGRGPIGDRGPPGTTIQPAPKSEAGIIFAPEIRINGTGDPQQIARAVRDELTQQAPQLATLLKRELRNA